MATTDLVTKKINYTLEKKAELCEVLSLSGNPTWDTIIASVKEALKNIYNVETENATFTTGYQGMYATTYDGKVFIFTANGSGGGYIYNVANDSLTTFSWNNGTLTKILAVGQKGKYAYVIGAFYGATIYGTSQNAVACLKFDMSTQTGTFLLVNNFSITYSDFTTTDSLFIFNYATCNDKLHVALPNGYIGIFDMTNETDSIDYDSKSSGIQKFNFTKNYGSACVSKGNYIYTIGGLLWNSQYGVYVPDAHIYRYDTVNKTETTVYTYTTERSNVFAYGGAFVFDNDIVYYSGKTNQFWVFSIENNTFTARDFTLKTGSGNGGIYTTCLAQLTNDGLLISGIQYDSYGNDQNTKSTAIYKVYKINNREV